MSAIKFKILDYIEGTGTQYIDSGVLPTQTTKCSVMLKMNNTSPEGFSFGSRLAINNKAFILYIYAPAGHSTKNKARFLYDDVQYKEVSYATNKINTYEIYANGTLKINGETKITQSAGSVLSGYNMYIFGANYAGQAYGKYGKLYFCKIYEGDVLVRDYIPALDNNNVACLFDKVTQQYYYNQGTGTFTAGNIIGTYTNLIYDRTEEDVEYAKNNQDSSDNLKGAYNYTDLNRVEEWTLDIGNLLNLYGYDVSITTKTDWAETDFPTKAQMKRIRDNVSTLKNAYISFTNVPENLEKMTYTKANQIEKVLEEIYLLIGNMETSFWYSGEINSGEV